MMRLNDFEKVVLAALLHDIGKFRERAGEVLGDGYKDLFEKFLPRINNKFTHIHAIHSAEFLKEAGFSEEINYAIMAHHTSDREGLIYNDVKSTIVVLSDWLSSGERRGKEGEDAGDTKAKEEPLVSIFSQIQLKGLSVHKRYVPLKSLDENAESLFPKISKNEALQLSSYKNLWNNFVSEVGLILSQGKDFNSFFHPLLSLLEKYTITVPSATYKTMPDIPLFMHLKTTAAIAGCLYLKYKEDSSFHKTIIKCIEDIKDKNYESATLKADALIAVKGDLSGIQEFIYSVASSKALRGLRARSIYLQLLIESVALKILEEFSLPESNIIYTGGGNFEIWIPSLENTRSRLQKIQNKVDEILLEIHNGKLGFAIAYTPLCFGEFIADFPKSELYIKTLGKLLARKKRNSLSHLLPQKAEKVFGPFEKGGEQPACSICGDELTEEEKIQEQKNPPEEKTCNFCKSLTDLGRKISSSNYLKINLKSEEEGLFDRWYEVFQKLGMELRFLEDLRKTDPGLTEIINNSEFIKKEDGKTVVLRGFRFMGKHAPKSLKENQIITLEELAEEGKGIKKWGVFRADVDNLGRIFSEGLKHITPSRIASLSYFLSYFFSAYIESLASKEEFKNNIFVIYSGGDDLFVIGTWNVLPIFAHQLYKDFREFTCNNPQITLSGAITIAPHPKFPIHEAARLAGKQLEEGAKQRKDESGEKNSLAFMGEVVPWEHFQKVEEIKENLENLISSKGIPRTILSILYAAKEDEQLAKEGKISYTRIWRLFYAFARFMSQYKNDKDALENLRQKVVTDTSGLNAYLNISVRWADYLTRKKGGER